MKNTIHHTHNAIRITKILALILFCLMLPQAKALAAHIAVDLEHPDIKNKAVAEVSGDAEVSAYDAALIAQRAVGLIEKFPVEG